MLLNPHTDWKMPWAARQMRFVLREAWSLILACAGGWLHPILREWCLSGSVPGGSFTIVEDVAPPHRLWGSWPGHTVGTVNKHGVARCEVSPQAISPEGHSCPTPPLHMFPLDVGSDAVSRQTAGRYAGHCSTQSPSLYPPSNRDRIRNCQEDFGCDCSTPRDALILGDGKKAQCLRAFLLLLSLCVLAGFHFKSPSSF